MVNSGKENFSSCCGAELSSKFQVFTECPGQYTKMLTSEFEISGLFITSQSKIIVHYSDFTSESIRLQLIQFWCWNFKTDASGFSNSGFSSMPYNTLKMRVKASPATFRVDKNVSKVWKILKINSWQFLISSNSNDHGFLIFSKFNGNFDDVS